MNTSTGAAAAERFASDLAIKYADSPLNAADMEDDFREFLQLVRESPAERADLVTLFIDTLIGHRPSPDWLVAYCMRVLRWPEIRAAAEAEVRKKSPVTLSDAWDVLTAYGDDWTGRELFARVE